MEINTKQSCRKLLEETVQEARLLLGQSSVEKDGRAYTVLLDMTERAEAALAGKRFPFTCQREFWKRDDEDEICFYYKHLTMLPTFSEGGRNKSEYGLKAVMDWYKNREQYSSDDPCQVRLSIHETDNGNFFLSNAELEEIREKINTNAEFAETYKKVKEIADQATLEQRRNWYYMNRDGVEYSALRNEINLWKNCGYGANFTVPEDAKKIKVTIVLPSCENREEGLGYIWLKNFSLKSSNGDMIYLDFGPENELYLNNETREDCATWQSEMLDVVAGLCYTISFDVKQEGKFKEGLQVMVASYDEAGTEIDLYTYCYNKKSWIPALHYNLNMQCDAIVYMVSGDKTYAEKAKYELLHGLDDMCQGSYYWMAYGERPECSDSYGAVQEGRNLCSVSVTYALIEDAEVFTEDEKKLLHELIDFLLMYVLDLRDRTLMSFERAQYRTGNWQTDMCIGASMAALAFKDLPNREMWLDNAYAVVYGQMKANLNPDGSWPESIRYHHAVLNHLTSYARVLKRNVGIDWFKDTDLTKMFAYGIDIQTPAYEYFDGCISTPTFGDHKLSAGDEFSAYGLYVKEVKEINPILADKMYIVWNDSGRKTPRFWGESITVEKFMYPVEYQTTNVTNIELTSLDIYPDSGIYIFRNPGAGEKMDYLAVMSSKKRIGHGHNDQGSFILYKENVPLVMDTGIEGYFNSSTAWHKSSYSHACMLFASEKVKQEKIEGFINLSVGNFTRQRGFWDTPVSSKVLSCDMGGEIEHLQLEVEHPEGQGKQIRTFVIDKKNRTWTVEDEVEGYKGEVMFILPLMAKELKVDGNIIHMEGYYGMEATITIGSHYEKLEIENGKTMPVYPTEENVQHLKYVRIRANAADGFVVTIQ